MLTAKTSWVLIWGCAWFLRGVAPAQAADTTVVDSISAPPLGGSSSKSPSPQPVLRFRDTPGGVWRGTRPTGDTSQEETPQISAPIRKPLKLDEARGNFATVVKNFIQSNSSEGHWNYQDPDTEKNLKLELSGIDASSVELVTGTLYRGRVTLREAGSSRNLPFDFTVDFSPDRWDIHDYGKSVEGDAASTKPEKSPVSQMEFESVVRKHLKLALRNTNFYEIEDPILRKKWQLRFNALRSETIRDQPDGSVSGCLDFEDLNSPAKLDVDFFIIKTTENWRVQKSVIHRIKEDPLGN